MSGSQREGVGRAQPARRTRRVRARKPVIAQEPAHGRMALNVNEAAWLLGVSVNAVWNLLAKDQLPSFTVGRRRLIARSAIEDFVACGGTSAITDVGD